MSFPIKQFIEQAELQDKSPEYIKECLLYVSRIESGGFPVIFSIVHLAILIKIQSDFLRTLIGEEADRYNSGQLKNYRYNKFAVKKRRGGYREIMAPSNDLKYIQKWILVNILSKFELNRCCTGFRSEMSIYDNAKPHEGATLILKADLLNFYDTITEKRVYGVFRSFGYAKNLAVSLAKLCTHKHDASYWDSLKDNSFFLSHVSENAPVLPQGAPSSPMLANIIATNLDRRFEALAKNLGCTYTRYADDLCFSVTPDGKLPNLKIIRKILEDEGFALNEKKTCYMAKGSKQYVTGLTTTNGINVSKKWRRELEKHIYYCRKKGVNQHLEFRKIYKNEFINYSVLNFHDWLYGHICFINSINKNASKKLLDKFNKITWNIT